MTTQSYRPQTADSRLELTATCQIEAEAPPVEGKAPLPRFRMIAYTGGPMRLAKWRYKTNSRRA